MHTTLVVTQLRVNLFNNSTPRGIATAFTYLDARHCRENVTVNENDGKRERAALLTLLTRVVEKRELGVLFAAVPKHRIVISR